MGNGWRQCEGQVPLALFDFLVSFPDPNLDSIATSTGMGSQQGREGW